MLCGPACIIGNLDKGFTDGLHYAVDFHIGSNWRLFGINRLIQAEGQLNGEIEVDSRSYSSAWCHGNLSSPTPYTRKRFIGKIKINLLAAR